MSDKEFVDSIIEMFEVREVNEFYTDEEFCQDVRSLIFKYQIANEV